MLQNLTAQLLQLLHKSGLTSSKPLESLHFHRACPTHTLARTLYGSSNPAHPPPHGLLTLIHRVLSKVGLVYPIVTLFKSIIPAETTHLWANVSARGSQRADLPPCSERDHDSSLDDSRILRRGYICNGTYDHQLHHLPGISSVP